MMKHKRAWILVATVVLLSNALTAWLVWWVLRHSGEPKVTPSSPATVEVTAVQKQQAESRRQADQKAAKELVTEIERLNMFNEALVTAKDPVALALPFAYHPSPMSARAGISVLIANWSDPRSEEALAEIAKGPVKMVDEELGTRGPGGERVGTYKGPQGV